MKKLLLCFALTLLSLPRVSATEYAFGNFDTTLNDSGGSPFLVPLQLELGKFTAGFVPTLANNAAWGANWISGPTGFYDPSSPEWGASLTLIDNSVFALNAQLYLWVFNSVSGTGREWALFTDSSWLVANSSPIDPSFYSFDFSVNSVALVGSLDTRTQTAATVAIVAVPEPATWGLVAGISTLAVALWRRRRVA